MSSDQPHKPSPHNRSALTRKGNEEEQEEVKPTLGRRSGASKMPTRQDRIVEGLMKLDDAKLQLLTTRIGPDELAVALLDADQSIKTRVASSMSPDKLEVFNQYLKMGKEGLPSHVVDAVQGKLLRLI